MLNYVISLYIFYSLLLIKKKKKKKKIPVEFPWWRNLTWVSRATCFTISSHIGNRPPSPYKRAHTIMVVLFERRRWEKKQKKLMLSDDSRSSRKKKGLGLF